MPKIKSFFRSPFISAFFGGLVVAIAGLIAVSAGWVDADADTSAPAGQSPLAAEPVSDEDNGGGGLSVGEIYDHSDGGVAYIEATGAQPEVQTPFGGQAPSQTATGSGFVMDEEGHIVTNAHVVAGADDIQVTLGDEQKTYDAKLVGSDDSDDVAVIQIDPGDDDLEPLAFGSSEGVAVGDPVVAIGNPFGLDRTVTAGIVSAIQRQISAPDGFTISDVIQTDAPINPGNSGGPLLDSAGRVIGINSQIESGGAGQGNVGIGFAVPIDTASQVAQTLISDGEVEHAFLGIEGGELDPTLAHALNIDTDTGVLVQKVTPDSPAGEAGIETGDITATVDGQQVQAGGDVITAVDGEAVSGMDDVIAAVNSHKPGDELELELLRGDDARTVTVTLGERPDNVNS